MLKITLAQWAALTPALSYAASCFFFESIDTLGLFKKYRILPTDEETKLNRVSRTTVLRHVIVYHIFLTMGALAFNEIVPPAVECNDCLGSLQYWTALFEDFYSENAILPMCLAWTARLLWLVGRQFLALAVTDAWVFWWHYFTHKNTWLYRNVHAVHHRLYVPFSYGALYNHWADSIFGDYVAGLLGVYLIRLTAHEQMFFLWLVIFKVVEDHAAYELPWSPSTLLGRLTGCTSTYHHVHHQSWGIKTNFSPYFTWWDHLMGTTYQGKRSLIKLTESQSGKKYT